MSDLQELPVLRLAPPAELGVAVDGRPRRRHIAATAIDLAARGHLSIADAGNDPDLGLALDWVLTPAVPGLTAGHVASLETLRPHEQLLLGLVSATPSHLVSRVRAADGFDEVLDAARDDACERGWLRRGRLTVRTRAGRAVRADLRAARSALTTHLTSPDQTAAFLPQAFAVGLGPLWVARLGQQRPPPPSWFAPGASVTARGWLGIVNAAHALAAAPPPGGGAGSAWNSAPGVGTPWG